MLLVGEKEGIMAAVASTKRMKLAALIWTSWIDDCSILSVTNHKNITIDRLRYL